ncbi:MAG: Spy/CpxP family protein refolding chaperone [bacterium]|nr:Spy/CpxP family protein refolding chaperone [bacterium]
MRLSRKPLKSTLIVALLFVASVVTTAALAAPQGRGFGPGGGRGPGGPDGERLGRVMEQLDLTDTQREQVTEIFESRRETLRGAIESQREAREALMQQIHADDFSEAAIREAAWRLAELEADAAVARGRAFQEIRQVLTAAQLEELEQLRADMRQRKQGRRGGRGRHGQGFGNY